MTKPKRKHRAAHPRGDKRKAPQTQATRNYKQAAYTLSVEALDRITELAKARAAALGKPGDGNKSAVVETLILHPAALAIVTEQQAVTVEPEPHDDGEEPAPFSEPGRDAASMSPGGP